MRQVAPVGSHAEGLRGVAEPAAAPEPGAARGSPAAGQVPGALRFWPSCEKSVPAGGRAGLLCCDDT
jgi:hypothetical protein